MSLGNLVDKHFGQYGWLILEPEWDK